MQVVPSQRMTVAFNHTPLALYRALRHLNPSPYMYFVDCGDSHIVGSSPEILARARGESDCTANRRHATTRQNA